jgi:acetoacetate decarboxylase
VNFADIKANAFAMLVTSPAFAGGPYRFVDRESLIVDCQTETAALVRRATA